MKHDPIGNSVRSKLTDAQIATIEEHARDRRIIELRVPTTGGVASVTAVDGGEISHILVNEEGRWDSVPMGTELVPAETERRLATLENMVAVLFTPGLPQEEANEALHGLALDIAGAMVEQEIDPDDPPWAKYPDKREGMLAFMTLTRAMRVNERIRRAANANEMQLVIDADQANIGWTAPDGEYRTLEQVLNERIGDLGQHTSTSGGARQQAAFATTACREMTRVGVPQEAILGVAETGSKLRLREVGAIVQHIMREPDLDDEQRRQQYVSVLADATDEAAFPSAETLRMKWLGTRSGIPAIEYTRDEGIDSAWYGMEVDSDQERELKSRMRGAWMQATEPRYVVTTGAILKNSKEDLIRISEESDPVKRAILGYIHNAAGPVGLDYITGPMDRTPVKEIASALGDLVHYGLIVQTTDKETGEKRYGYQ